MKWEELMLAGGKMTKLNLICVKNDLRASLENGLTSGMLATGSSLSVAQERKGGEKSRFTGNKMPMLAKRS